MRYIAFDLGDKRTGVAVGDSLTGLCGPVDVVEVSIGDRGGESLLDALMKSLDEHLGPAGRSRGEIVVGLPINMDGTEGPRARAIRQFGSRIAERAGRELRFQDERLTSAEADWTMSQSGLTHKQKKERRDALAAAAILRDFLEAQKGPSEGSQG
jgi:putative Holliday junction resolvase